MIMMMTMTHRLMMCRPRMAAAAMMMSSSSSSSSSSRLLGSSSFHANLSSSSNRDDDSAINGSVLQLQQQQQQYRCYSSSTTTLASSSYTMAQLKALRSTSGAPIVECKKALQAVLEEEHDDTDNDDKKILQDAMDWLRKHGAAKASAKVMDRETTEGLVSFLSDDTNGGAVLVKVASETDFAGRSDTFVQLVETVTQATLPTTTTASSTYNMTKEEIDNTTSSTDKKTIQQLMDEAIIAIRENISVTQVTQLQNKDNAMWIGYVHNRMTPTSCAGTAAAAVLVAPEETATVVTPETLAHVGKQLAMHVVAARPKYLAKEHVPAEVVAREQAILEQQIIDSGKPAEIAQKIVLGRMSKFYADVCLLDQGHALEEKNPKVGKVLKDKGVVVKEFQALFV